MGQTINYASERGTSINTELRFALLPQGTRVPTEYTITVGAAAAAVNLTTAASVTAKGATTITASTAVTIPAYSKIRFANGVEARVDGSGVSSDTAIGLLYPLNRAIPASTTGTVAATSLAIGTEYLPVTPLPVALYPGEKLVFNSPTAPYTAVVSDFCPAGAISVQVQPTTVLAVENHTAKTNATLYIAGATDASPTSQPKTVDAANFLSGAGMEMVTTGTNRQLSFSFQRIIGDPAADLLMQLLFNDDFVGREVYATVKRPFGEEYAGACIMTNGSQASPVQDLITVQADMQFQGSSFVYTPPTGGYDPADGSYTPPLGA